MKKPLVIISACQFTRLALESLIPTDRYIVRVYSNVTVTNGAIVIHTQRLKSDPGGNLLS